MPSSITLRPYQQNLIDSINEALTKAPRVMLQLPTGGGKTVIFCQIVKQYLDNGEFTLNYCPTTDMIADILTKPLQGSQFIKLRNRLLGYDEASPNTV